MDGTDCTAEEMSKALEHTLGGLGNSVVDYNPSRVLVSNKVNFNLMLTSYVICKISYRMLHNLNKIWRQKMP